jgi:hypothetical protein
MVGRLSSDLGADVRTYRRGPIDRNAGSAARIEAVLTKTPGIDAASADMLDDLATRRQSPRYANLGTARDERDHSAVFTVVCLQHSISRLTDLSLFSISSRASSPSTRRSGGGLAELAAMIALAALIGSPG